MDEIIEKWSERGFQEEIRIYQQMDIVKLVEEVKKCEKLSNKYLIMSTKLEEYGAVDVALYESDNYSNLTILLQEIINQK